MTAVPANDTYADHTAMSEAMIDVHGQGRRLMIAQARRLHPADLQVFLPTFINGFAAEGALMIAAATARPESDTYFDAWQAGLDLVIAHLQATKLSVDAIRHLPSPAPGKPPP